MTGPRDGLRPEAVEVLIPGSGRAAVPPDVRFRYLDRWSALTTWRHQEPPMPGDSVIVPYGQSVLVDVRELSPLTCAECCFSFKGTVQKTRSCYRSQWRKYGAYLSRSRGNLA